MEALEVDDLISLKNLNCHKEQHLQSRTKFTHVFIQYTFYATQTDAHAMTQIRLTQQIHKPLVIKASVPCCTVAAWSPSAKQTWEA